jgi:hypothetical protein
MPDLTYELISNSAAFEVVAWTVSMSPTPKPNVPVPNPVTASPTPKPNVPVPNPTTASPTPKPSVPVPNPVTASPTPKPNVPAPNPMTASPTHVPTPTYSSYSGRDDDYGYNYYYAYSPYYYGYNYYYAYNYYGYNYYHYSPLDDDTVTSAAPNGTISCDTPTTIGTVKFGSVYYDLTVTASTMLTLSTCNSLTSFDTVVYIINDARDKILVYNDDDFDCDAGSRKSTVVRDVVPGNNEALMLTYCNFLALKRFCLNCLRELPCSCTRVRK